MDLRDALLVLHIAGAGIWLGANIIQAVVPPMTARLGVEATAGWYRVAAQLSKKVYMPAAILLLITGVFLVLQDGSVGFTTLFVMIGFGMIIIGALFGIFVFDPGSVEAAEAVESADQSRIRAATARLATFGTTDTLLLLFTMTVMVLRLR